MDKKKKKLKKFFRDNLNNKNRAGYGRPKNKGVHNETPYIHADNTFKTYLSQCYHFADWCYERGIKYPEEAYGKVPEYGKWMEDRGLSAWTVYTAICAIAKGYGVTTKDLGYKVPKRERQNIKRSRNAAERDKHFSEKNNKELIIFGNCTGLRRSELEKLRGNQLAVDDNGKLFLFHIKGKGGKIRNVDLIGSAEEITVIKKTMAQAGEGLVFPKVHSAYDEHYHRSLYACRAYRSKARDVETLDTKDKYICRKDKAGTVYDRQALLYISRQLGHNRADVVVNSYLYNL